MNKIKVPTFAEATAGSSSFAKASEGRPTFKLKLDRINEINRIDLLVFP